MIFDQKLLHSNCDDMEDIGNVYIAVIIIYRH